MSNLICFDIYPRKQDNVGRMARLLSRHGFKEKNNKFGTYFHAEVSKWDAFRIQNLILCHRYNYKRYEKCWDRSDNYRSEFFKHNNGPYRCAYCGRRITSKDLEVDHLIPVSKAKSSRWARFILWMNAIYNVNNYRNLVASCKRCNRKKSDNMGLWVVIGSIGRFRLFWNMIDFMLLLFIVAVVGLMAFSTGALTQMWNNIVTLLGML